MAVRLRIIREKRELFQQDVADILKIGKSNYNYFETEERIIGLRHLNNFCNYFDVSMDYVFGLSDKNVISKKIEIIDKKIVGERIKEIRLMKNLTQKQLAEKINTSQSTISSYESGKTLILTAFLYELCKRLDVSMDYITGRSNVIKMFEGSN